MPKEIDTHGLLLRALEISNTYYHHKFGARTDNSHEGTPLHEGNINNIKCTICNSVLSDEPDMHNSVSLHEDRFDSGSFFYSVCPFCKRDDGLEDIS